MFLSVNFEISIEVIKYIPQRRKFFFKKFFIEFVFISIMLEFSGFLNERICDSLHKFKGSKSEFGFATEATASRSVAKRMSELLDPLNL